MARPKKQATDSATEPVKEESVLDTTIKVLEKQFGEGIITTSLSAFPQIERISTGSLAVDLILGGGLPRGRIVELGGKESSGKTTCALHTIVQAQKMGLTCAFIDAEHALDAHYAKRLGVNMETLLVTQPDCGEQALQVADTLMASGVPKLIVVDSVAALVPQAELEGEVGDASVGRQAQLMSRAMRRFAGLVSRQNVLLLFINQIRNTIGGYGSPETSPGGNALRFYASVRLDIRRTGSIAEGDDKTGITSRVKIVKSKVCPPFQTAEITIRFGEGIDTKSELINLAIQHKFIKKSGSWLAYGDQQLGQGPRKAADTLETLGLTEEVKQKIIAASTKGEANYGEDSSD